MTVPERRQQVFVSSTYLDLKAERQSAVQAILNAGHIPAGMELFAAGDQSQLDLIKRWIEESDIFMLILGARYGSIEAASGKSYIQLEYDHAISLGKPYFAVYMTDEYREQRLKTDGSAVIEMSEPAKLRDFREVVMSKHCSAFNDLKDIELAVHKALPGLIRDYKLRGWVRAGANEEVSTLIAQIGDLQSKISSLQLQSNQTFNGATFDEVCEALRWIISVDPISDDLPFGNALHVFRHGFENRNRITMRGDRSCAAKFADPLERFGLVEWMSGNTIRLTQTGHRFNLRLQKT